MVHIEKGKLEISYSILCLHACLFNLTIVCKLVTLLMAKIEIGSKGCVCKNVFFQTQMHEEL